MSYILSTLHMFSLFVSVRFQEDWQTPAARRRKMEEEVYSRTKIKEGERAHAGKRKCK
eukprot:gene8058-5610_t